MNQAVDHKLDDNPDLLLSVVVPVFNELENIEPLVEEIRHALDGLIDYEILYVDDGSSDGSPALLEKLAAQHARLRFVAHETNCGQSAAMVTGVVSARGALIATLDGDGQNDPADIPKLLAHLSNLADSRIDRVLVVGRRERRRDTWLKRISSRVANGVRSRMLNDQTPDTGSGLKVFTRSMFLALPMFDHMHRFLPALVIRNQGSVISVATNHRQRRLGTSKYGLHNRLWIGIIDMLGVMWLQRRPMRASMIERLGKRDV